VLRGDPQDCAGGIHGARILRLILAIGRCAGRDPARDLIELSQQAEAPGAFDALWVGDSLAEAASRR